MFKLYDFNLYYNLKRFIGIPNGWVKLEGRMPGDQARVSCNIGFQIAGISHLGRFLF